MQFPVVGAGGARGKVSRGRGRASLRRRPAIPLSPLSLSYLSSMPVTMEEHRQPVAGAREGM
jgi:hypothetical protein